LIGVGCEIVRPRLARLPSRRRHDTAFYAVWRQRGTDDALTPYLPTLRLLVTIPDEKLQGCYKIDDWMIFDHFNRKPPSLNDVSMSGDGQRYVMV
jgi:hypothetical protein